MPLKQMIYVSELAENQDPSCLDDILRVSSANNPALNVTGILLFINGSFLQVLEGPDDRLESLYARICEDRRHQGHAKILYRDMDVRQFSDWSMGHPVLSASELDQISGLKDFFTDDHGFMELNEDLVQRVVDEFLNEMWRRRIR